METGGEIVGKEFEGVSGDEQLACTNGDSALGGSTCTGGGSGDGTTEKCDSDCSNGSNRVAAECTGMTGGTFDCLCTDGANAGKSFTVKSCEELFSDNLWNRCNVK